MKRRAFTLVELLVVIAIIGLLSSVAVVSLNGARVNSRNAKRKADFVQLSKALEMYYSVNNAYPTTGGSAAWQGVCTSFGSYPSSGAGGWVPNLAPTYVGILPSDPAPNKSSYAGCTAANSCYIYTSDGTNYKILAHCSPEGTLSATDPFADPPRLAHSWSAYSDGARAW